MITPGSMGCWEMGCNKGPLDNVHLNHHDTNYHSYKEEVPMPVRPVDPLSDIRHLGNPDFIRHVNEMLDTHVKKAAGYAGSDNPDTWANFREAEAWGATPLLGCFIRMGDKYRRVQNLRRNAANDRVGESIRDTLMDLANYAIIAVCLMDEEDEAAVEVHNRELAATAPGRTSNDSGGSVLSEGGRRTPPPPPERD